MTAIDLLDVRRYRLPLDPPFHAAWDPTPRRHLTSTIVRVEAGGVEGVGAGGLIPGVEDAAALFVGRELFDIERHVAVLDNVQFHYGRMWPVEVALWDAMGKLHGEPLWRRLGGSSPRVEVYASTGERQRSEERAAAAERIVQEGFRAIKLRIGADGVADGLATVRAVREAAGPDVSLLVDANQGWRSPADTRAPWTYETALRLARELKELDVFWLEEPLHRHDYEGLARLRRESGVRIAGGEGAREPAELRECLRHGSLDVYQPDVTWSTGVLQATRIAREVQAAGALYTPHTWGDGLVLLANLHVAAAMGAAPFVEFPYDPPAWTPERRDFTLPAPIAAKDGCVTLSERPGLGVEIDWDAIERYRVE